MAPNFNSPDDLMGKPFIALVTMVENCPGPLRGKQVVSHGVDLESMKDVILPSDPPNCFPRAVQCRSGHWVIPKG